MRAELTLGRSAGRRLTPSIHNVMWKYVDVELSKCRIGTRSTQRTKQKNVVINAIEGISAACKQDLATDCTTRSAFDTSPLALVYPIAVGVTRHRGTALLTCASRVAQVPDEFVSLVEPLDLFNEGQLSEPAQLRASVPFPGSIPRCVH
jgi:5-deoxy-D-glucuronate isomerase